MTQQNLFEYLNQTKSYPLELPVGINLTNNYLKMTNLYNHGPEPVRYLSRSTLNLQAVRTLFPVDRKLM